MGRRNHGQRHVEGWRPTSRRKQIELIRKRDLQTILGHVDELHKGHNLLVLEVEALKRLVVEEVSKLIGERARSGVLLLPNGIPGLSTTEQLRTRLDRIRLSLAHELLARESAAETETPADLDAGPASHPEPPAASAGVEG